MLLLNKEKKRMKFIGSNLLKLFQFHLNVSLENVKYFKIGLKQQMRSQF